ncbi:MAG TPA: Lrp/AsnC ligand binding domain-containing protein [Saprospiraceae bacterium]|nr:Lrp/AsnC ligand binding domain-containing protein [Saprospiraceae bacterium]HNM26862.1 Lrp/AsnC ligand binding domain-containing protein [Saprospiraceae bacterium]
MTMSNQITPALEQPELDELDKKILAKLVEDGKLPYTEIAKELFVSSGTIHVRMKKLEQAGVVTGSSLRLDYHKLGYDITAFLGIYLDKSSLYDEVSEQLKQIPEIVEANYTTGLYSVFVKIVCKDTNHLRLVLHDKIQKISGIQRTETFISLEQSINRPVNFLESD